MEKQFTNKPELLQVASLTPMAAYVSASRADMHASEVGQALGLIGCEVKQIQSGMEREYGKRTFRIEMPVNARVCKVINDYSGVSGSVSASIGTPTFVLYQDMDSPVPKYDALVIPLICLNHHMFGFRYKRSSKRKIIQPESYIAKGEVLAHTPTLTENGDYRYGINANILMGSFPGARQDGVIMSESLAKRMQFNGYGEIVMGFDGNDIPLNTYGDDDNYKIFPDVGDVIRPDGIVCGTRRLHRGLWAVQTGRKALKTINNDTDDLLISKEGGRVISVEVFYAPRGRPTTPSGMVVQPMRYLESQNRLNQQLKDFYRKVCAENPGVKPENLLHPELHNLLVRAEASTPNNTAAGGRVNFQEGGTPLREWTVKITYEYNVIPTTAHKIADSYGGKGVIVDIWPDERMPFDQDGNRAEILMDGGSIVNRLNPARCFEIDITASLMRLRKQIVESLAVDPSDANKVQWFNRLCRAYEIISPPFAEVVRSQRKTQHDINTHLAGIVKDQIYVWIPTDLNKQMIDVVKELHAEFPPCRDRIWLTKPNGEKQLSKLPGVIGRQYIILLEKTGDEYSAVSAPRLQHPGIPGKLTKADKQSSPGRPQATRLTGETEGRLINSLVYYDALPMLLDIANSPTTFRNVCRTIITHPSPTNIDRVVDRTKNPRGGNRIVCMANDALYAAGYMWQYKDVSK